MPTTTGLLTRCALSLAVVSSFSSASCSLLLPGDTELLGGRDAGTDGDASGAPIFDEEFDATVLDPSRWVMAGDGVWSIDGGTGLQSNSNARSALLYARAFADASNYHIAARMRSTGPFGEGHDLAPEIAFRVDPSADGGFPDNYNCAFDLMMNILFLQADNVALATTAFSFPPGFDAGTPFVLDAVVSGTSATCTVTVDGLGKVATVGTNQLTRASGSFGLKTYDTAAQFYYFRVYQVD
jgi:hypothetical protein